MSIAGEGAMRRNLWVMHKVIALHGYSSAGIVIHEDMYKDLLRWGVPLRPLVEKN